MNREIDTVLTNEIIAINRIESKKETFLKIILNVPTSDIKIALVASKVTTRSAVVGPLINRYNVMNKAIPKIIAAAVIKKFVSASINVSPPE